MRLFFFIFFIMPLKAWTQDASFSWQEFSLGSPVMSVLMPGKPLPQSVNLPQALLERIKRYDGYYYKDQNRGIVITMMHIDYTNDITADFKGAAEGTVGQWEATGSRVEVQSSHGYYLSGKPGYQIKGVFYQGDIKNDFTNIVIGEGSKIWQIVIIVRSGDETLSNVMQRITGSIKFKMD